MREGKSGLAEGGGSSAEKVVDRMETELAGLIQDEAERVSVRSGRRWRMILWCLLEAMGG